MTHSCNRHEDCDKAEQEYIQRLGARVVKDYKFYIPPNFHCYDEYCDECFGE